ncbi:MAG: MarR family winged helix-turn-helix transcriptional regulator [Porticoccaceae bacterium]
MTDSRHQRSDIGEKVIFRLYQAANLAHRKAAVVLRQFKLSPQQASILGLLSRPNYEAGMTINQLVNYLMVSRQNLNGVLKRIEKAGYIERVVHPDDLRSRQVRLSPLGWQMWQQVEPVIEDFYCKGLQFIPKQEQEERILGLNRLIASLKAL